MTITLRPLACDDAEELALLHVEVWKAAYGDLMPASIFVERRATLPDRVERWRCAATTSPARTFVAIDDAGRLRGFSSDGPSRDEDLPDLHELWGLYVDAAAWGTGVGHRLLTNAIGDAPAFVWVLAGNDRAIDFYTRQGFAFDGTSRTDDFGTELRMRR